MLNAGLVERIAGAPFNLSANPCTAATVIHIMVVIILGVGIAVRAANITCGSSELSMKVKNRSYHYVSVPFGFRFAVAMDLMMIRKSHANRMFPAAIRVMAFPQQRRAIS